MFTGVRAKQPVTHMRSTNRKHQPSKQFPMDKIKSRPSFSLVPEAVSLTSHNREEKIRATSASLRIYIEAV